MRKPSLNTIIKISFIMFVICSDVVFILYSTIRNPINDVVYKGNLAFLEQLLPPDKLKRLTPIELRILRNTVYAKHGYDFGQTDLEAHFGQFEWYQPKEKNIDNELTPIDNMNVRLVQHFESNYNTYHLNKKAKKLKIETNETINKENEESDITLYNELFQPRRNAEKIEAPIKNGERNRVNTKNNERYFFGEWKANSNFIIKFNEDKTFLAGLLATDNVSFGEWHIESNTLIFNINGEYEMKYGEDERIILKALVKYFDNNKMEITFQERGNSLALERLN
jgi:hypothetical protein